MSSTKEDWSVNQSRNIVRSVGDQPEDDPEMVEAIAQALRETREKAIEGAIYASKMTMAGYAQSILEQVNSGEATLNEIGGDILFQDMQMKDVEKAIRALKEKV